MKTSKVLQIVGSAALLAAGAFVADAAQAACLTLPPGGLQCGGSSNSWNTQITDACRLGDVTGMVQASDGTKVLVVNYKNSFYPNGCLEATGMKSDGSVVSACYTIDRTADGSSTGDGTGCNSATRFSYHGTF